MEENFNDLHTSIKKLEGSVLSLEKTVKKQTSFKRIFALSLVHGFGTAAGATVIFGLILALVLQVIKSIDYVPIINNLLSSQAIESVISKFTQ